MLAVLAAYCVAVAFAPPPPPPPPVPPPPGIDQSIALATCSNYY